MGPSPSRALVPNPRTNMNTKNITNHQGRGTWSALTLVALTLFLGACSQSPLPALTDTRTYDVRGIVREAPDLAEASVSIEHEDIPGYMPAMTMSFDFRDAKEVASLRPGDAIAFKLNVTETDSWMNGVQRIDAAKVKLPVAKKAPAVAKVERVKEGDRIPDFELVDQSGRSFHRDSFAGRSLLVTFIFTRCPIPNYCPLMSRNFRALQSAIRSDSALAGKVNQLSISFDEKDTPAVLAQYGAALTDDFDTWQFATGKPAEVQKLTGAFAVLVQPDSVTISHGLATALIGPDGVIRQIWRGNGWKTDEVLAALRTL